MAPPATAPPAMAAEVTWERLTGPPKSNNKCKNMDPTRRHQKNPIQPAASTPVFEFGIRELERTQGRADTTSPPAERRTFCLNSTIMRTKDMKISCEVQPEPQRPARMLRGSSQNLAPNVTPPDTSLLWEYSTRETRPAIAILKKGPAKRKLLASST